jgi:rod shape-determining protein MreB
MPFFPSFSKDLGIDLGTIQTRIADSTGILVDEPTVVAIVIEEQKMVEFGKAAGDMAGRVQSETIEVAHPLQNGVVADYEITEALLHYLLQHVSGPMRFFRPRVMISVPYGLPALNRGRSTRQCSRQAAGMLILSSNLWRRRWVWIYRSVRLPGIW